MEEATEEYAEKVKEKQRMLPKRWLIKQKKRQKR